MLRCAGEVRSGQLPMLPTHGPDPADCSQLTPRWPQIATVHSARRVARHSTATGDAACATVHSRRHTASEGVTLALALLRRARWSYTARATAAAAAATPTESVAVEQKADIARSLPQRRDAADAPCEPIRAMTERFEPRAATEAAGHLTRICPTHQTRSRAQTRVTRVYSVLTSTYLLTSG